MYKKLCVQVTKPFQERFIIIKFRFVLKNYYKIFILFIQRYNYTLWVMKRKIVFVAKISKQFKELNFILFFILKFQGSELTFLTVHCTEFIPTEKCFYYILSFLKYNTHQHKLFSQGLTKK